MPLNQNNPANLKNVALCCNVLG